MPALTSTLGWQEEDGEEGEEGEEGEAGEDIRLDKLGNRIVHCKATEGAEGEEGSSGEAGTGGDEACGDGGESQPAVESRAEGGAAASSRECGMEESNEVVAQTLSSKMSEMRTL